MDNKNNKLNNSAGICGWRCPNCNRIFSPLVSECPYCNAKIQKFGFNEEHNLTRSSNHYICKGDDLFNETSIPNEIIQEIF